MKKYLVTREDKGVRELIPHIGPIPILIPLKLFLEGIELPRIMLPRALRGSFVEEESINIAGIVKCEIRIDRIALFILFFNFYMDQSASRKRNGLKFQPRQQSGTNKV